MVLYRTDILILFISFIFLIFFVCFLLFLTFLLSPRLKNIEKISPYECGFNPFEDTRSAFEVHFYLIALLFLIFDLEIAFLLPWMLVMHLLQFAGFWIISLFLLILTLGFAYEIFAGAIDWD